MRAGIHEAQIIGNFHQVDGQGLEQARHFNEDIVVLGQVDRVFCRSQADARQTTQFLNDFIAVLPRRRIRRTDSRAAEVDHAQTFLDFIQTPAVTGQGLGISTKFFACRHGNGIHELRPPQFIRLFIGLLFMLEGFLQVGTSLAQFPQLADGGDPQGRRVDVIRRLAAVDVIQGMDDVVLPGLFPQLQQGRVGNDFIDVHVRRRTGAALKGFGYKSIVILTGQDSVASRGDGLINPVFTDTEAGISQSSGFLNGHHGINEIHRCPLMA